MNIYTYERKMKMDKEIFICDENCPHWNKIDEVKLKETTREEIQELSEIFKLFADETRLRIICCLLTEELCVCDLTEILQLNQSTVSHSLQLLKSSKLVKYRREGKQIYYSLQDSHIEKIVKMAIDHIREEK